MKTCKGCKFAEWEKTRAGKLHPSGDGICTYMVKIPELPASRYYLTQPQIFGGFINRKSEFCSHCVYYQKRNDKNS